MNKVLILGAGTSWTVGYPLREDLLPTMAHEADRVTIILRLRSGGALSS